MKLTNTPRTLALTTTLAVLTLGTLFMGPSATASEQPVDCHGLDGLLECNATVPYCSAGFRRSTWEDRTTAGAGCEVPATRMWCGVDYDSWSHALAGCTF